MAFFQHNETITVVVNFLSPTLCDRNAQLIRLIVADENVLHRLARFVRRFYKENTTTIGGFAKHTGTNQTQLIFIGHLLTVLEAFAMGPGHQLLR